MTTYFITRHRGARDWAARRGYVDATVLAHLDNATIAALGPADAVLGTLPVQVAAAVCAAGARYQHLSMETPPADRGRDLSADDMERFNARLEAFWVERR